MKSKQMEFSFENFKIFQLNKGLTLRKKNIFDKIMQNRLYNNNNNNKSSLKEEKKENNNKKNNIHLVVELIDSESEIENYTNTPETEDLYSKLLNSTTKSDLLSKLIFIERQISVCSKRTKAKNTTQQKKIIHFLTSKLFSSNDIDIILQLIKTIEIMVYYYIEIAFFFYQNEKIIQSLITDKKFISNNLIVYHLTQLIANLLLKSTKPKFNQSTISDIVKFDCDLIQSSYFQTSPPNFKMITIWIIKFICQQGDFNDSNIIPIIPIISKIIYYPIIYYQNENCQCISLLYDFLIILSAKVNLVEYGYIDSFIKILQYKNKDANAPLNHKHILKCLKLYYLIFNRIRYPLHYFINNEIIALFFSLLNLYSNNNHYSNNNNNSDVSYILILIYSSFSKLQYDNLVMSQIFTYQTLILILNYYTKSNLCLREIILIYKQLLLNQTNEILKFLTTQSAVSDFLIYGMQNKLHDIKYLTIELIELILEASKLTNININGIISFALIDEMNNLFYHCKDEIFSSKINYIINYINTFIEN